MTVKFKYNMLRFQEFPMFEDCMFYLNFIESGCNIAGEFKEF